VGVAGLVGRWFLAILHLELLLELLEIEESLLAGVLGHCSCSHQVHCLLANLNLSKGIHMLLLHNIGVILRRHRSNHVGLSTPGRCLGRSSPLIPLHVYVKF